MYIARCQRRVSLAHYYLVSSSTIERIHQRNNSYPWLITSRNSGRKHDGMFHVSITTVAPTFPPRILKSRPQWLLARSALKEGFHCLFTGLVFCAENELSMLDAETHVIDLANVVCIVSLPLLHQIKSPFAFPVSIVPVDRCNGEIQR